MSKYFLWQQFVWLWNTSVLHKYYELDLFGSNQVNLESYALLLTAISVLTFCHFSSWSDSNLQAQ